MAVGFYCPATRGECDHDDCVGALCTRITPREVADQRFRDGQRLMLQRMDDALLVEEVQRRGYSINKIDHYWR